MCKAVAIPRQFGYVVAILRRLKHAISDHFRHDPDCRGARPAGRRAAVAAATSGPAAPAAGAEGPPAGPGCARTADRPAAERGAASATEGRAATGPGARA